LEKFPGTKFGRQKVFLSGIFYSEKGRDILEILGDAGKL
jgi:hypothetical protein